MVWNRVDKVPEPFCENYQVFLDNPDSEERPMGARMTKNKRRDKESVWRRRWCLIGLRSWDGLRRCKGKKSLRRLKNHNRLNSQPKKNQSKGTLDLDVLTPKIKQNQFKSSMLRLLAKRKEISAKLQSFTKWECLSIQTMMNKKITRKTFSVTTPYLNLNKLFRSRKWSPFQNSNNNSSPIPSNPCNN